MKGSFLRIIFDIIVLIVLALLIFYIIMVFIGMAMGNELKYIKYLNSIADDINNGMNGEVFINNYDYNYVFVLTYNNGWYLQLYHCLPPNFVVGLLSVKVAYWNVSTTDNGNIVVFAPALAFCKLVKQRSLNVDQINIKIQGLNDEAGLLVYSSVNYLQIFQILISIMDSFFPTVAAASKSMFLAILNDTTITCDNNGCMYSSKIENKEISGKIYCAPNPNVNTKNNNLPYNPSVCVELSGFPRNPQVQLSNFVGEIISSETLTSLIQTFQMNFPILYFAGSLPPTVIYMDISSDRQTRTANINIYIGETVS